MQRYLVTNGDNNNSNEDDEDDDKDREKNTNGSQRRTCRFRSKFYFWLDFLLNRIFHSFLNFSFHCILYNSHCEQEIHLISFHLTVFHFVIYCQISLWIFRLFVQWLNYCQTLKQCSGFKYISLTLIHSLIVHCRKFD